MVITHSVISTTITDQQVHDSTIQLTLIYDSDKENDVTLAMAQQDETEGQEHHGGTTTLQNKD
jgi:hypothetical protein